MMSRIDKLRFSVACTDRECEIVISNDGKQTTPHDEPTLYLNGQSIRVDSALQQQITFLCWFMPRRMEHFFFYLSDVCLACMFAAPCLFRLSASSGRRGLMLKPARLDCQLD